MKRSAVATLLMSVAFALPGCPIFDDEGCSTDGQCAPGYSCQLATGECLADVDTEPQCDEPQDCRNGGTCDRYGQCRSIDCSWADVGCVQGYECARDEGVWRCVRPSNGGSGGSGGSTAGSGGAGPSEGGAGGLESVGGWPASGGAPSDGGAPAGGEGGGETGGEGGLASSPGGAGGAT